MRSGFTARRLPRGTRERWRGPCIRPPTPTLGLRLGYVDEAKLMAETGDRDGARQVVEAGERASLDPIERANLEYVAAAANGDVTGRMKALESLTTATPANANIFAELGELRFATARVPTSGLEYRAAARLDPESPQSWNQLGYALAWAKDLHGAREALGQYQKLAPENPMCSIRWRSELHARGLQVGRRVFRAGGREESGGICEGGGGSADGWVICRVRMRCLQDVSEAPISRWRNGSILPGGERQAWLGWISWRTGRAAICRRSR